MGHTESFQGAPGLWWVGRWFRAHLLEEQAQGGAEQSSHVAVPPLPVDKARQVSVLRVGSFPCSAEGSSVR